MIFIFEKRPPPKLEPLPLYLELPIPPIKEAKQNEDVEEFREMIIVQIT